MWCWIELSQSSSGLSSSTTDSEKWLEYIVATNEWSDFAYDIQLPSPYILALLYVWTISYRYLVECLYVCVHVCAQ